MEPERLQSDPDVTICRYKVTPAAAWGGQQQMCTLFDALADAVREQSRSLPIGVRQHIPETLALRPRLALAAPPLPTSPPRGAQGR